MTAFVLPHHANKATLHGMLHKFRDRLASKPDSSQLANMFNALHKKSGGNTHHYMIYWPLTAEAFNTKRCLYEQSVNAVVPQPKAFHFVYITSLLTKLHPKKDRFRSCKCKDHAKQVPLDWAEFVYPQFVELLFRRSLTPSKCPSPLGTHTIQVVNEELQCRFEIDKEAAFLTQVDNELFKLPCAELYQRHRNSHLTVFGSENVQQERHFRASHVNATAYKLQFVITQTKLRAYGLKGGGRLVLKKTAEPYVLIVSNFEFIASPSQDGATHYNFYVPSQRHHHQHQQLAWHANKRIKSDKFCAHDTPCMIVSTSPLAIEFKAGDNGCFILYSPGECTVNLVDEVDFLELWNKEPGKCGWPLRYEINTDVQKAHYVGREARFYEKLHARYYNLFTHPICERFEMHSPAHGYVTMYVENEIALTPNGESYIRTTYRDEQACLNQYASNQPIEHPVIRSASYSELLQLRVYAKQNVCHFYLHNESLRVTEESYQLGPTTYKINTLWRREANVPLAHFYMNREATYVLFIPL